MRAEGLRVYSPQGDLHLKEVQVSADTAAVGAVDAVLVAVKAWQLDDAIAAIPPLIGSDTVVVPLLNGVEAPDALAQALGEEHVLAGLCGIVAYIDRPGCIRHIGIDPWVRFGEIDNSRSDRVARLQEAFTRAPGVKADVPEDIQAAMWQKFLFIAPTSGVGAITRANLASMRENPETRELIEWAMREALAVGQRG